jgi:hypothetical protein
MRCVDRWAAINNRERPADDAGRAIRGEDQWMSRRDDRAGWQGPGDCGEISVSITHPGES